MFPWEIWEHLSLPRNVFVRGLLLVVFSISLLLQKVCHAILSAFFLYMEGVYKCTLV